jgi:hypothetical protein
MQSYLLSWIDYLDLEMRETFYLQKVTGNRITRFTEEEWSAFSSEIRKMRVELEECFS